MQLLDALGRKDPESLSASLNDFQELVKSGKGRNDDQTLLALATIQIETSVTGKSITNSALNDYFILFTLLLA